MGEFIVTDKWVYKAHFKNFQYIHAIFKNSETNCIRFPFHLLTNFSPKHVHPIPQLYNQKQVSHLGAVTLLMFGCSFWVFSWSAGIGQIVEWVPLP
jgi:hypothetical protein